MKTKVVWFIAAFVTAPLFPLCYGQANQVDNRLGYNPGNTQTYTYSVTNPGQPQYNGTVQYGGPGAYTAGPAPARQPVVAQQPIQPQVAYQQTIPQTQGNQQVRPQSTTKPKKKAVQSARPANTGRLIAAQPANQRQQVPAARQYQPNCPAQPRPVPNRDTISSRRQATTRTRIRHGPQRAPIITRAITTIGARPDRLPPGRA